MHVIWFRSKPACGNARANGFINSLTADPPNPMGLIRLPNRRHASWHGRCKSHIMRINKIRWRSNNNNPTTTLLHGRTERYTNVPRSARTNPGNRIKHVILLMFKMQHNGLNIRQRA